MWLLRVFVYVTIGFHGNVLAQVAVLKQGFQTAMVGIVLSCEMMSNGACVCALLRTFSEMQQWLSLGHKILKGYLLFISL